MNLHRRACFFLSVLLLIAGGLGVSTVAAQGTEGIEMKPAVIEDRVNPGDLYNFVITVTNISGSDKPFYLSAQDITGLDEQGLPVFAVEGTPTVYELSSWIRLPAESIVLKAGESRQIPFSVKVPNGASPGAHFGGVFIDARPPKLQSSGAAVGLKVGTIINLRIAGEATEEARLREFSTSKIVYGLPQVDFKTRVENMGNVLLRPHGVIEVSDMRGKKIGTVEVNSSGAAVFPGGDTAYTSQWTYDGFAIGRYQAAISLAYGEDVSRTVSAVTSFWVLPLKLIGIVLLVLLVIIAGLFVAVRVYIKSKLREMGATNAGAGSYAKKYRSPLSRLLTIALTILLLCVVFLGILFFFFA